MHKAAPVILALAVSQPLLAQATDATRAANRAVAAEMPSDDREDEDFATRGLIAKPDRRQVRAADGRIIWDLDNWNFIRGAAPDTVNPSLWRLARLMTHAGLFKVADRVYQVRGYDASNMTIILGDTGLIVVDPLMSAETAAAALEFARRTLGHKPVRALIYTHPHIDHYAGSGGIVDPADVAAGRVQVIAPENFVELTVTENVLAGNAMNRRARYQAGSNLAHGATAMVTAGIALAGSSGTITLVPPTHEIKRTGETLTVDGVHIEFQLTPNTEAPAEMHFFLKDLGVLCLAENASATIHNIMTPRGAPQRDAKAWADYLTEALRRYGARTEALITSHHWPRFGNDRVKDFLGSHRDAYKFLHDQSVRLLNTGYTGAEIADRLRLPPSLSRRWFNRGYYGTMMHNSRAVYHRYMGWYDGNPARLDPLPPEAEAERFVRALGGADRVLAEAQRAFDAGDYRWALSVLDRLVFADGGNAAARTLLAQTHRQLAYQAESAIWRNMYLTAAIELEQGVRRGGGTFRIGALAPVAPSSQLLDLLAIRLDPARAGDRRYAFNLVLTDRDERFAVTINNSVLVHERDVTLADVPTLTASREALLTAMFGGSLDAAQAAGTIRIAGNGAALKGIDKLFETPNPDFNIVTP